MVFIHTIFQHLGSNRVNLTSVINDLPDNDSFLPRYLTVKLLDILAKSFPTANDDIPMNDFINSFKHPEYFNPLTSSVFWNEDYYSALNDNMEIIDDVDQYNRAPLIMSLAKEDFAFAAELVEKGANIYLEDKLILEIALLSILQRDSENLNRILENCTQDDLVWLGDYLSYLYSYAQGEARAPTERDVINPPLRHFGQVLDTLVYFNGLPSYYGFLSPSLEILLQHLSTFADEDILGSIYRSFALTFSTCDFHGNYPRAENAAPQLHEIIQQNITSNSVEPVILIGGWSGNALAIAFINNYLLLSNLGNAGDLEHGTYIYRINNPQEISIDFIDYYINGLSSAADPRKILNYISNFVDYEPVYKVEQSSLAIDNCIYVNPRIIIESLMLVLKAFQKHGGISQEILDEIRQGISISYKEFIDALYRSSTENLAVFMKSNDLLRNKRLECCSLALEYINQHYQDPNALPRCIELKNALEYVGLQDYYIQEIKDEARDAIQNQMIHEQELAAVEVIRQEQELLLQAANTPQASNGEA